MNSDRFRYSPRAPLIFLCAVLILALCIYLMAGTPAAGEEIMTDSITLYTATDLHYISPQLTDNGSYFMNMIQNADGKVADCSEGLTDAFLAETIAAAPAALILSGDLTFNGEKLSHEDLAEKLQAVEAAGIPVLVMPGNHDLNNSNAASFSGDSFTHVDSITADEFAEIYADFGFSEARSRDSASLSYCFCVTDTLWILMLDVNTEDSPMTVKDETLTWLERQLSDAQKAGAQIIAVSHQNLMQHNSIIVNGYLITNSRSVLDLYEQAPVLLNLAGHLHCQHVSYDENGFCEIATSSLAVTPNQYGIVTVSDAGTEYHTQGVDVASWAEKQGLTDEKLLNFPAYSLSMFTGSSDAQALAETGDTEDADEMAAFYTKVNLAYFAGRMDTIDPNDPLFARWQQIDGFIGMYLASTLEDNCEDFTHVTLPR